MELLNTIGSICSILGLVVGLFLAKQIVSIKSKIQDSSITQTKQSKNKVGGDQAGRDINK